MVGIFDNELRCQICHKKVKKLKRFDINNWLCLDCYDEVTKDEIEPISAERTCQWVDHGCTNCDYSDYSMFEIPERCPGCGAKIVGHKTRNMSDKENTCEGCKYEGTSKFASPCYDCTHVNYNDCYEMKVVE